MDAYAWVFGNFGAEVFFAETELVTPTPDHFPAPNASDNPAKAIFARVQAFAGMENWQCELVAQEPDTDVQVDEYLVVQNVPRSPAGTFSVQGSAEGAVATITYNPDLLRHPESLIATFAHELGHYLGETAKEPPPGGSDFWEPATDLLAVAMGFGIFMANSAFSFRQYHTAGGSGWQSSQQGYLSQAELAFALAVFAELKKIPSEDVEQHLSPTPRSFFRRSRKNLTQMDEELLRLTLMRNKN